jgi:hypothetical protein
MFCRLLGSCPLRNWLADPDKFYGLRASSFREVHRVSAAQDLRWASPGGTKTDQPGSESSTTAFGCNFGRIGSTAIDPRRHYAYRRAYSSAAQSRPLVRGRSALVGMSEIGTKTQRTNRVGLMRRVSDLQPAPPCAHPWKTR